MTTAAAFEQVVSPSVDADLSALDPEIAAKIDDELTRQRDGLEMIASENFVPQAILECQGSVLTNKYAEGYPGKRYYGGCEFVDVIEQLAIDRAKALFGAEHAKKVDSAVFPGQQGGPLMHVVAAKAVAMKIAQSELFRERQRRTRAGAAAIAEELTGAGVDVLTGGTDVHLVLVDLRDSELDGQQGEDRLHAIGITVNRNSVPNDPRPPAISSGLRIGTPALATRGFQVEDFHEIGKIVATALTGDFTDTVRAELSERTRALAERYPLYPELATSAAAV